MTLMRKINFVPRDDPYNVTLKRVEELDGSNA